MQAQPQLAAKKAAAAKEIAITAHAERPRKSQVVTPDKADMHSVDDAAPAPVSALPAAPTAAPASPTTAVSVSPNLPCFRSCLSDSSAQFALHALAGRILPG